jgi:hypothetical protein
VNKSVTNITNNIEQPIIIDDVNNNTSIKNIVVNDSVSSKISKNKQVKNVNSKSNTVHVNNNNELVGNIVPVTQSSNVDTTAVKEPITSDRSQRIRTPTVRYVDEQQQVIQQQQLLNTFKKKQDSAMYSEILHDLYACSVIDECPLTYKQAMSGGDKPKWSGAINEEITSLLGNDTWTEVTRTPDMHVIKSKWVFKIKEDGRYKARLVACGYGQEEGVDYHETFAPVLKYKTFRVIIALSTKRKKKRTRRLKQLDVKTAFLNAKVKEDIYVLPPDGIQVGNNKIFKLNKALYGIKQAPHEWNQDINSFLKSLEFRVCVKDTCVYIKTSKTNNDIIIGLFVDDILISYDEIDENEWNEIKKKLKHKYEISDIGDVKSILGMRITINNNNNTICIDQNNYINVKLKQFQMNQCRTLSVPGETLKMKKSDDNNDYKYINDFRMKVGSLIYAAISTRPDITHAVNIASRYMSNPDQTHMNAVNKILRYLNESNNYGLMYKDNEININNNNDNELTIFGYCDADWGGDINDRTSTTGYCTFIDDNLISWNTKKQQTVAISTAEAEYMAAVEVTKELLWLKQLLNELNYEIKLPIKIYIDNLSAIYIAQHDVQHDRTKHIDIKYHFIKQYVEEKIIELEWISTEKQLADIFTKALGKNLFTKFRNKLMKRIDL